MVQPEWVGLWSPGLQAVGGIVELFGAILLVLEWRKSIFEDTFSKFSDRKEKNDAADAVAREFEKEWNPGTWPPREVYLEPLGNAMKQGYEAKVMMVHVRKAVKVRQLLYNAGFFLIFAGVFLQISANGIAWASVRGFFDVPILPELLPG